jgi:hypothetical protein
MFLIDLIHMLDPIQYEFRFFQNTSSDPEPEPKLLYSGSGQKFWLRPAPAPQPWSHTSLHWKIPRPLKKKKICCYVAGNLFFLSSSLVLVFLYNIFPFLFSFFLVFTFFFPFSFSFSGPSHGDRRGARVDASRGYPLSSLIPFRTLNKSTAIIS